VAEPGRFHPPDSGAGFAAHSALPQAAAAAGPGQMISSVVAEITGASIKTS